MNVILNFKEIIRQYVAPHKRQPVRLRWLWALTDIGSAWDDFAAWRDYYRYKVHVTSQHQSLQSHLRRFFGADITLLSYQDYYLAVGLDTEPAHWAAFDPTVSVALEGEADEIFDGANFAVYVPKGSDTLAIAREIEKYKLADKTYKIIER